MLIEGVTSEDVGFLASFMGSGALLGVVTCWFDQVVAYVKGRG